MHCIKAMSKRSSLSDGSRRGGIVGEAAWEVKKKCRWWRVPQEVVDTFLVHRHLPPGILSLGVIVRAWYTANVNQSAGRLLLLTRARLAFSISRFLRVGHEAIGLRDCPQMKFQWKVFAAPFLKVPAFIPYIGPSHLRQVHLRVHSECKCVKRWASSRQDVIDSWVIKLFEVIKIGGEKIYYYN